MISFDNRFVRELPADPEKRNFVRQTPSVCYSFCEPSVLSKEATQQATTVCVNEPLLRDLGIQQMGADSQEFANIFSGQKTLAGMQPYAMCYGGHQFGNWAGQLGDGRAINLGEIRTDLGHQTLQLKGAGMTPYSRHADGFAVLRSSIREYLCSEAMFHLGVPTTRALSLVLTGEQVERDMFYDGRPAFEPGAVVCRVAPSFIRFGSFEIFSARADVQSLKQLVDFCIKYDFSETKISTIKNEQQRYIAWFQEVVKRSCEMVVHWQRVGFVHGVMNTDNMSILGLTIDYGPYGWTDNYDPDWTPNTTDLPGRRYCFANQAKMVHWNLFQLAKALLSVIDDSDVLQVILNSFPERYEQSYLTMMAQKLGLQTVEQSFVTELEEILHVESFDMTLFFRLLADYSFDAQVEHFYEAVYSDSDSSIELIDTGRFESWLQSYQTQLDKEGYHHNERKLAMDKVNPCFVLRNYLSQEAIEAAEKGDYSLLKSLETAMQRPYLWQEEYQKMYEKRPNWAKNKAGCSMLSCSS